MDDGTQRTVTRLPMNMKRVAEGSLDHAVAEDPEGVQGRFEQDPTGVVTWMLRDTRTSMNKGEIEAKLTDLLLPPPADWWPKVSKELKSHAHVLGQGQRYTWSDVAVEKAPAVTSAPGRGPARPRRSAGFGEVVTTYRDRAPTVPRASTDGQGQTPAAPGPENAPAQATESSPEPEVPRSTPPPPDARDDSRVLRTAVEALLTGRGALPAALQQLASSDRVVTRQLAVALRHMAAPDTPLELTDVDLTSCSAALRYELGRLALQRHSFSALLQCVLVAEPPDAARLIDKLPVDASLLQVLTNNLLGRPRFDARAADRWEHILRRLTGQGPLPADTVPAAVSLLATLARIPSLGDHQRLLAAGQTLLDDCLGGRRARPALTSEDRTVLLALVTSPLVRPAVDPRERWIKLVLALDDADRSDVLEQVAVWTSLDVKTLSDRPRLAELLHRRALGEQVVRPLLQGAAEDANGVDVLRLLALPDVLLQLLTPHELAGQLQRLAQGETTLAQVLTLLSDRIQAAQDRAGGDEAVVQLRNATAEVERLSAQLAEEQQAHDRTRSRLDAHQNEERAADTVALAQARNQALQVVIEVVEELRLASLAAGGSSELQQVTDRVTPLLAAEGLQAWGRTDEVMPYDPTRFRLLGEDAHLAAGEPAVVVRPAYVLSEGEATVLRYGEVRPAGA